MLEFSLALKMLIKSLNSFGPFVGLRVFQKLKWSSRKCYTGELLRVPIDDTGIALRANTSDIDIFRQIFLNKDCELPFDCNPEFIIDAGAHIGCTARLFSRRFPDAKIIAIEPENKNFELLKRNTQRFPKIECLHAGIWGKKANLVLEERSVDTWGFSFKEAGDGKHQHSDVEIPSITISELLVKYNYSSIDIIKLDIEGAELAIFTGLDCDYWLSKTHVIIIELHDRKIPGCTEAFMSKIERYNFMEWKTQSNRIIKFT